ncbi:hypothetical protein [Streptomyces rubellomurinus]|uniref:Uncharacterized protein n=2 Tax=Streptomyces TaxID=1883 RepID=A0A0F2TLI0_STRR3|nr:hypothetical protein [Streptomyces rubellomurinus]KJS57453.1 hypothetical protein VM98_00775 [Streptomyces rubellomurinus subsp. indigoferus]KJS62582.1 hypothetical protein VM95_08310 [Streptomyces rubellomurinus]
MSYPPTPNNPYGPPQEAPGYGYPQQPPQAQPAGYGYPQQAAPAGYGYPQAAPGYAFPPAAPKMSMPGMVITTRVLLFIVGSSQILLTALFLLGALGAKSNANRHSETSDVAIINNMASSIALVLGIVFLLASVLSMTLGVKLGRGGPATRITTLVYGSIALLLGAGIMVFSIVERSELDEAAVFFQVFAGLWIAICVTWIVSMSTRDGVAWFDRPRY